jgi:hypothetical protein
MRVLANEPLDLSQALNGVSRVAEISAHRQGALKGLLLGDRIGEKPSRCPFPTSGIAEAALEFHCVPPVESEDGELLNQLGAELLLLVRRENLGKGERDVVRPPEGDRTSD